MPPTAEMERAYLARDSAYDGLFFLGVRTTGIFCRPTCAARKPLPKNVEYFPNAKAALAAGYRPCKRCRPLQWDDQPPWASELISELGRDPAPRITDDELRARGIDPATARRHFLRRYGLTFQAFARARRRGAALQQIRNGGTLDAAVFESGYDSHSGFRDAFAKAFGGPPGGCVDRESIFVSWLESSLGPLMAVATADGVCLLEFTERGTLKAQLTALQKRFDTPVVPEPNEHLEKLRAELAGYFAGSLQGFSVPLSYRGTAFQQRVWEQLLAIPYGETRSYEQLAVAKGQPKAVRAVGHANDLNRICILIPCHRVVNKDGRLGGYGGGLRRKQYLLELERANRHEPV